MPLSVGVPWAASQACSWIGTALAVEGEAGRAQGGAVQVGVQRAEEAGAAVVAGRTVDVAQLALIGARVEEHVAEDALLAGICAGAVCAPQGADVAGLPLSQVEARFALPAGGCPVD